VSSISLSFGSSPATVRLIDEEERPVVDDRQLIWNINGLPYGQLHRKIPGRPDAAKKGTFYEEIQKPGAFNPQIDALCGVQINAAGALFYRVLPYAILLDAARAGQFQFVHEAFVPGRPFKPKLDIDREFLPGEVWSIRDSELFCNRLIRHLCKKLGFDPNPDSWCILETIRPNKLSLHVVYNGGVHFADANAFLRFMMMHQIKLQKFNIDTAIYRASGSTLRAPCSTKFDEKLPVVFVGIPNNELTMPTFLRGFGQYVPFDSRLIEVEGAPLVRVVEPSRYDNLIQPVLAIVRDFGNPDVTASAIHFDEEAKLLTFDLDNCTRCKHVNHGSDCQRVSVNPATEVCIWVCRGADCADRRFALTEEKTRWLKLRDYIVWLDRHGLCRADMILFNTTPKMRTFGRYGMSPEEFFASIRTASCNCEFCQSEASLPRDFVEFDPPEDGGPLINLRFFLWLRAEIRENYSLLAKYLKLFVAYNTKSGTFYFRTNMGLESVTKHNLQSVELARFKMDTYKFVGKGDNRREVMVEKPFFPYFLGMPEFSSITDINEGYFVLCRDAPLNMLPPTDIDVNDCLLRWRAAPGPIVELIMALWGTILDLLCVYEPREHDRKIAAKRYLQRWFHEIIFCVGKPTKIMVLTMSDEGGIFKSTVANLVRSAIGSENYHEPSSFSALVNGAFNSGTNRFINLDEISFRGNAHQVADLIERLKQGITQDWIHVNPKYVKSYMAANIRNYYGSTNDKYFPAVNANGFERRMFILKLLSKAKLVADGLFDFRCKHCQVNHNEDGDEIFCSHSFTSFDEFIGLVYEGIIRDGPLKELFFGYQYALYRELRVGYLESLQASMVCTRATADMQLQVATRTQKIFQEFLDRGFHCSPSVSPKLKTTWLWRSEDTIRLGNIYEKPIWEKLVPVNTLYSVVVDLCVANGTPAPTKDIFLLELESLSMSWMQKPLTFVMENCDRLEFDRHNAGAAASWLNSGTTITARVIDMGDVPWQRIGDIVPPPRKNLDRSQSFRAEISASMGEMAPDSDPPSRADTNFYVDRAAGRKRTTIMDLADALREEDARDEFDAQVHKSRRIQDLEDDDGENYVNSSGEAERNPFIDNEAAESDMDENDEEEHVCQKCGETGGPTKPILIDGKRFYMHYTSQGRCVLW